MVFIPETIAPQDAEPWWAVLTNLNVVIPAAAAIMVSIAAIVVVCVLTGRKDTNKQGESLFVSKQSIPYHL